MKRYINWLIILLVLGVNSCCKDENAKPKHEPEWKRINFPNPYIDFTDVDFCNNNFGVICGTDGVLQKTENGGKDWLTLNVGTGESLMSTFVLNENEFYAARVGLYKTSNGGSTFGELGNLSSIVSTIFCIHFFNTNNGLIVKSGWVYKTSDGGQNWDKVYQVGFCAKWQFVSDSIGYSSGGASWDGMSGGELHKTVDWGNTWTNIGTTPEVYSWEVMAMYFINKDTGFIANYNKEVYITHDGGSTWFKRCANLPNKILDMVFLSENEGYGAGYGGILKTTDGGITWDWDYKDGAITLVSIAKTPDNKKIIAVGSNGVILKRE